MSKSKNKLLLAIQNYLEKVEEKLKLGGTPLIYEQSVVLSAGLVREYDIKATFPDHNKFRLMSTSIEVLVKDTDAASPTYDMFINSQAVITTAIDMDGNIKIHNSSNESQTIIIKISTPSVRK